MGAKHMPRGAVTKARNLQLYNDGPVKEWMDIFPVLIARASVKENINT